MRNISVQNAFMRRAVSGQALWLGVTVALGLGACSDLPTDPGSQDPASARAADDASWSAIDAVAPAANPLQGARLYVDPRTDAALQAAAWRRTRSADASQMDKIASQPHAIWLGDWNSDPYAEVQNLTARIHAAGALPVYVLYNIPQRDCGLYSSGGAAGPAEYGRWVAAVARGIGSARAVVVLEPDAVPGLDCLSARDQEARIQMIRDAVHTLKSAGKISIYIDAGNARWHDAAAIAARLERAGIAEADGFALNVSNFVADDENVRFGTALSDLVGGKHFVIDTGRNGLGPTADFAWCNPSGRALGRGPTTSTGIDRVDAFLWIKAPGESDGECNGGPAAGTWWPEYALELARRAA